jgi:hypothetical protein
MAHSTEERRERGRRGTRLRATTLVLALLLAGSIGGCHDAFAPIPEATDLLDRLNELPGVTAWEVPSSVGFGRAFELDIVQPLDHQDPDGRSFVQRAYLTHTNESDLMVFAPGGYAANWRSSQELGVILRANTLNVTHRFFIDSEPNPMEWRYLNVRQSAADHHRIVTLLKQIYSGQWLSSGASKSGETVLFHRRFYPGDVAASVAYVAPLLFSAEDPRFQPFLESIGTPEDRAAIRSFQRRLLLARDSLLGQFEAWYEANGYTLSLPVGPTFEGEVMSYDWSFWQYTRKTIADIPGPEASYDEMLDNLAVVSGIGGSADRNRYYYRPYVYQAYTEIGYPARDHSHLADLLVYEPLSLREEYDIPLEVPLEYRPEVIPDILQWVQTEGNNIIFIYGGADPWTGGAIELTGQTNALKITKPGANHRVRIAELAEREVVLATLGQWLGLDLNARVSWPAPAATFDSPRAEDLFVIQPPGGGLRLGR